MVVVVVIAVIVVIVVVVACWYCRNCYYYCWRRGRTFHVESWRMRNYWRKRKNMIGISFVVLMDETE